MLSDRERAEGAMSDTGQENQPSDAGRPLSPGDYPPPTADGGQRYAPPPPPHDYPPQGSGYPPGYGAQGHGAHQGYGPPLGYGAQYAYPGAAPEGTNGLAIASLVCSLVGLVTILPAIPGVILGFVARSQIRARGGRQGGAGLALAGIIIGFVMPVFLLIIGISLAILLPTLPRVAAAAHDKAAQADLTNALVAANVYKITTQSYTGFTTTTAASYSPFLTWDTSTTPLTGANTNTVGLYVGDGGHSIIIDAAGDRDCWLVLDTTDAAGVDINAVTTLPSPGAGTWYGEYSRTAGACDSMFYTGSPPRWAHTFQAAA